MKGLVTQFTPHWCHVLFYRQVLGYKNAEPPKQEQEAKRRRKIMRRARSKKLRGALLAELEQRYLSAP